MAPRYDGDRVKRSKQEDRRRRLGRARPGSRKATGLRSNYLWRCEIKEFRPVWEVAPRRSRPQNTPIYVLGKSVGSPYILAAATRPTTNHPVAIVQPSYHTDGTPAFSIRTYPPTRDQKSYIRGKKNPSWSIDAKKAATSATIGIIMGITLVPKWYSIKRASMRTNSRP